MAFQNSYNIDLHTHSIISYDGGISEKEYMAVLSKMIDYVAITDHNTIEFAAYMHKKYGEKIIVGEEIKSADGEVIGLFLKESVRPGLLFSETLAAIHQQKGLVYIPHPCESQRHSVQIDVIKKNLAAIDIIEAFNARSFGRKKTANVESLDKRENVASAASSDAHCLLGMGSAYTMINTIPSQKNLAQLIMHGEQMKKYAHPFSYLCPVVNKIKKRFYYEK